MSEKEGKKEKTRTKSRRFDGGVVSSADLQKKKQDKRKPKE